LPDFLPTISADIERMEEIMMNLLSNASKYSPIGSNIILSSGISENNIVFKIEDSAKPISDEEKEKLFQPYYRGENDSESSQVPGLGLGLSICRKLVELHMGKIWIENNGNKGNIFCFSIPIDSQ
jgi:two-component system sensor histidine kinase ChiS